MSNRLEIDDESLLSSLVDVLVELRRCEGRDVLVYVCAGHDEVLPVDRTCLELVEYGGRWLMVYMAMCFSLLPTRSTRIAELLDLEPSLISDVHVLTDSSPIHTFCCQLVVAR